MGSEHCIEDMTMRVLRLVPLVATIGLMVACTDPLSVANTNDPNKNRVFARSADVEALAGSLYQRINSATLGSIVRTRIGMLTASFENASGLANNGLGPRSGLPRGPIDNGRGNPYPDENFNDFSLHEQVARTASDILARSAQKDFLLPTTAALLRMKAFTFFAYGTALGNVALVYDSAAVPRPTDGPQDNPANVPPLVSYKDVMAYALTQLDSAIAYGSNPAAAAAGGFPLPTDWLRGNPLSAANFVRLVRSYKARLRAGVARNPAERAAVNWAAVVADAQAGITSDFLIDMDPSKGWDVTWLQSDLHFRDSNWHQMTPYIIGMADSSGAYDAWLQVPRDQRSPFLIRTADLRFPSGDNRATQNAAGQGQPTGRRYLRNRTPGGDQAGLGWQNSQYDHYRFRSFADANRIGLFPVMTRAEIRLLAAEGLLQTGAAGQAAVLIDSTRTTAGLPSLGLVLSATDPVPNSSPLANDCVPRVPPPTGATVCGTVFEAMKWEKRMETAYTGYGAWFFDSRGWGDLPEGTPVHWPVPFQELDARLHPIDHMGGVGRPGGAAVSTYGFGTSR
ncbi:MAG: hypothetical protein NVS1B4_16930 [Gemmatimonadaceae bacterium]